MRRAAADPLSRKGLAMGIFGGGGQRGRAAAKGYNFAAHECLQVLCDRCHAAWAKVEVITSAGSVFFCQHHHKQYRHSVIAAGHQIRAVLGKPISGHGAGELGAGGHAGLPEHLPQVVVDGGRAQEQLRGDVPVAVPVTDRLAGWTLPGPASPRDGRSPQPPRTRAWPGRPAVRRCSSLPGAVANKTRAGWPPRRARRSLRSRRAGRSTAVLGRDAADPSALRAAPVPMAPARPRTARPRGRGDAAMAAGYPFPSGSMHRWFPPVVTGSPISVSKRPSSCKNLVGAGGFEPPAPRL
jgi:hypothetical protein